MIDDDDYDEIDEQIEAGARFALRIRRAVQEPERWAIISQSAREMMAVVTATPIPPELDEIAILALAYVASIRCSAQFDNESVQETVASLKRIAGVG
jgi:hypothetical protein